MTAKKELEDFIMDYFKRWKRQDIYILHALRWATDQYCKCYRIKPFIISKSVEDLCKEGKLTKVREGVYRYDPEKNK